MKKAGVILAALCAVFSSYALDITADAVIVTTGAKGTPEKKAPMVLQKYLSEIFGKTVSIVPEKEWKKGNPAIVLKSNGKLEEEEWRLSAKGNVLTVEGGWPRGLYYGVSEFLDTFGGVRWFTPYEVKIPRKTAIHFPDGKVFQRKPAFPLMRCISSGVTDNEYMRSRSYLKQNRISFDGEWPTLFRNNGLGGPHSFHKLTKALPKGMERMLPVESNGTRQRATSQIGPGQICFANPEFRAYAKKEIGKWIANSEAYGKKHGLGNSYRCWIELSQNDNRSFCQCKGCKALEKKYGALSGALLDFINDVASAYPDQLFQTFAYGPTQDAPKNIKARDNVMVQFALLSDSDLLRPMGHPNNAKVRKQVEAWKPVVNRKACWWYHRLYTMTEAFPWPQCCFWYVPENIRYYRDLGAQSFYLESEYAYQNRISPRAFHDLHNYLEAKLMDDPDADAKAMIEEFFEFQYGPAAPVMKRYAAYLKKRLDAVPGIISARPVRQRGILDKGFFQKVNGFLKEAENRLKDDPKRRKLVELERIPVDYAAAETWKEAGNASGVPFGVLMDRLEKNICAAYDRYYAEKGRKRDGLDVNQRLKKEMEYLYLLRNPLPVPKEFAGEDVVQISMLQNGGYARLNVPDPEAAYGQAQKLGKLPEHLKQYDHDRQPMNFGLYDHTTKKYPLRRIIRPEEVPTDEKYHLYYVGRHAPNGFHREQMYGHRSWKITLQYAYKHLWNPVDQGREWDIYVSCKLTGPAYVKGSKSENAVYVDKILAVKRGVRKNAVQ